VERKLKLKDQNNFLLDNSVVSTRKRKIVLVPHPRPMC